ncbi:MAG: hypothetical protein HYS65_12480, partial [Betaproteobacteria bacterium]|nr:hypothetical protein [Betaproteobacteria bacterium]
MSVISPWYQLGYVIPHLYTDLDAYQFYRVAPEGMMLVTTGLNLKEYSLAAVEQELPVLRERFDLLAQKKVDRISLSGVPVASALGRTRMREILAEAQARTGLACDTDLEAQIAIRVRNGLWNLNGWNASSQRTRTGSHSHPSRRPISATSPAYVHPYGSTTLTGQKPSGARSA